MLLALVACDSPPGLDGDDLGEKLRSEVPDLDIRLFYEVVENGEVLSSVELDEEFCGIYEWDWPQYNWQVLSVGGWGYGLAPSFLTLELGWKDESERPFNMVLLGLDSDEASSDRYLYEHHADSYPWTSSRKLNNGLQVLWINLRWVPKALIPQATVVTIRLDKSKDTESE